MGSWHNFAHVTTAELLWHVQNSGMIESSDHQDNHKDEDEWDFHNISVMSSNFLWNRYLRPNSAEVTLESRVPFHFHLQFFPLSFILPLSKFYERDFYQILLMAWQHSCFDMYRLWYYFWSPGMELLENITKQIFCSIWITIEKSS